MELTKPARFALAVINALAITKTINPDRIINFLVGFIYQIKCSKK